MEEEEQEEGDEMEEEEEETPAQQQEKLQANPMLTKEQEEAIAKKMSGLKGSVVQDEDIPDESITNELFELAQRNLYLDEGDTGRSSKMVGGKNCYCCLGIACKGRHSQVHSQ